MVTFVGAGPGAEDLITVRGQQYLKEADIIVLCRFPCEPKAPGEQKRRL
jgi:precorrin-4/cobalt-precorrin-4 C11-methyltransferase